MRVIFPFSSFSAINVRTSVWLTGRRSSLSLSLDLWPELVKQDQNQHWPFFFFFRNELFDWNFLTCHLRLTFAKVDRSLRITIVMGIYWSGQSEPGSWKETQIKLANYWKCWTIPILNSESYCLFSYTEINCFHYSIY